ncbi:hypothetical protein EVAR_89494_1 [Eumeta japonica]|uniref:Uncharacterized protein n=1 Tax=Eumeta variegata TaxID=151549 RepID=A0A4C1XH54_EUMVA|nr:hypothetical protein EVAR_89494_1 [Eumeta japonica]
MSSVVFYAFAEKKHSSKDQCSERIFFDKPGTLYTDDGTNDFRQTGKTVFFEVILLLARLDESEFVSCARTNDMTKRSSLVMLTCEDSSLSPSRYRFKPAVPDFDNSRHHPQLALSRANVDSLKLINEDNVEHFVSFYAVGMPQQSGD